MSARGPGFFAISPGSPPSEFAQVDAEAGAEIALLIQLDSGVRYPAMEKQMAMLMATVVLPQPPFALVSGRTSATVVQRFCCLQVQTPA